MDVYIPTNHLILKNKLVQRLHSDACIRASLRWYPGWPVDARRHRKLKNPPEVYFGINCWVRRRELTRYNGYMSYTADTTTQYDRLDIGQTIQGGSLFIGLEAHPGRRVVVSIQGGVQVFGWKNSYGEPVNPTTVYGERLGRLSTVNRPGTGGAALLHVDVQLACLLNL